MYEGGRITESVLAMVMLAATLVNEETPKQDPKAAGYTSGQRTQSWSFCSKCTLHAPQQGRMRLYNGAQLSNSIDTDILLKLNASWLRYRAPLCI